MSATNAFSALFYGLFCGLFLSASTGLSAAEEDATRRVDAEEGPRCISLQRLRTIDIIDNQTLLFKMRGERLYVNNLPHKCPGLDRHSTLLYRTNINQLCNLDSITVLESFGSGFMPGATCGLGKFSPVSELQARALKQVRGD